MQRVHRQTIWLFFFFSSCFLQHFVRSPVLCHFDPEGGCALTCDTLMLQFMFRIEWSIHHMLTAHSNQSVPITWDCPSSRTSASIKMTLSVRLSSASKCGWLCEVHVNGPELDMCNKCVFSLFLTARDEAIHLSHCKYVNTQQTLLSKPPQQKCSWVISLSKQCYCYQFVFLMIKSLCQHFELL